MCAEDDVKEMKSRTRNHEQHCPVVVLMMVVVIGASLPTITVAQVQPEQSEENNIQADCGIYLAPSSIPNAGLGMYAGNKHFQEGDAVADSDLVIPIFELEWHNGFKDFMFLWDEYVWSATMFPGMEQEVEDIETIHVCSGGFGAAVNCMLPLVNVEDEDYSYHEGLSGLLASSPDDDDGLSSTTSTDSPGAGAFTPYGGRKFVASKNIEPGSELYVSYGENYFESRVAYESVPLSQNYKDADTVIKKMLNRIHKVRLDETNPSSTIPHYNQQILSDLWTLIKDISTSFDAKRFLSALPDVFSKNNNNDKNRVDTYSDDTTKLHQILKSGGTSKQHYNASIRSLDWLQEHGQCMDNIKDGKSRIPHAGRGAFANRFIPQGGLVAPAPLIQMPKREMLTMYAISYNDRVDMYERDITQPNHQQLLLNYCFGHNDTTMLLCPYGLLTALINHGSGPKANTKIKWSDTSRMRHPEWLNQSIDEFEHEFHSGLAFDFVALRDIQEDEEVLIDYGEEWEHAWQQHLKQWEIDGPPRRGYVPGFEMNNMLDLEINTLDEVLPTYDFVGIHTYCHDWYVERDGHAVGPDDEGYTPCRVIKRYYDDSNTTKYTVELWDVTTGEFNRYENHTVTGIVFDLPRDAFYFEDSPYTRDHHQEWSFRHDMRIPDEMIPDSWKNIGEDGTEISANENHENSNQGGEEREGDVDDDDSKHHHKKVSEKRHIGMDRNTK